MGSLTDPYSRLALEEHTNDPTIHSSGRELGYAELTSNFATTSTSFTDITGLSISVTVGVRPIKLIFDSRSTRNTVVNGGVVVAITDASNNALAVVDNLSAPAGLRIGMHREKRHAPAAGAYTFKARILVISGTGTIEASADSPTFLQAIEC